MDTKTNEELIALAAEQRKVIDKLTTEKQEAEARAFEMSQKYHDAVEGQAAPAAAVVTVDTPEVRCYLMIDGNDHETNGIEQFSGGRTGGIPLVALPDALAHTARAVAAKQAIIDRLMLEHCPGEMSAEQMATWEASQRRAPEAAPQQHAQEIPEQIDRVGNALSETANLLSSLHQRLAPIMPPSAPEQSSAVSASTRDPQTPLGSQLADFARIASQNNTSIRYLLERIKL